MMIVHAINNTTAALTYSSVGVTIPANSTVTLNNQILVAFVQDPYVKADILSATLTIGDDLTVYRGSRAIDFILGLTNPVGGTIAAGFTDYGNPVKVGAVYNTTLPVLSNGQRGDMQLDRSGNLKVTVVPFPDALNNYYMIDTGLINAGTGATDLSIDNPILLVSNPSTSTKTLSLAIRIYGCAVTNVSCMFRVYVDPTVTSNGPSRTINPAYAGNSIYTVAQAFTLPTVSSMGILMDSYIISQNSSGSPIVEPVVLQLPPNHKWLVTAAPSSNNRPVNISIKWTES